MENTLLDDIWAVILCGGRGSRLGSITETLPKPLVEVHDKPILWYTFLMLYKHGFRNFIFPLGYKGHMIKEFICREFEEYDCTFHFVDTGEDTLISGRLQKVTKLLPDHSNFFLLNGDTFFDFDIIDMYLLHRRKNSLLTLSSVEITSAYGIIIEKNNRIVDFSRDKKISHFSLDPENTFQGYVNAGLTWLNKDALDFVDLGIIGELEQNLFPILINNDRACHYKIEGNWFSIDTQKDLDIINSKPEGINHIGYALEETKKSLEKIYNLLNVQEE